MDERKHSKHPHTRTDDMTLDQRIKARDVKLVALSTRFELMLLEALLPVLKKYDDK